MTESERLLCSNPWTMVECLSERKQHLLACAYCRGQWCPKTPQLVKLIVETAERQADGLVEMDEVVAMQKRAELELWHLNTDVTIQAMSLLYKPVYKACLPMVEQCRIYDDSPYLALWVRELIGNPFHLVAVHPTWLMWSVVQLAQAIYDGRDFDHLPILADALEEAGCTDAAILDHCRQPGEHARGCWVIDLLLGKK